MGLTGDAIPSWVIFAQDQAVELGSGTYWQLELRLAVGGLLRRRVPGHRGLHGLAQRAEGGGAVSRTGSGPTGSGRWGSCSRLPTRFKPVTKEDLIPRDADRWVHLLAAVLVIVLGVSW